jgi:ATP-binding cassette subfamily F protein 3
MIQVKDLSKSFGSQVLFKDVTFTINKGERIGLVGRNGHGKSTLFNVLLGQMEQDGGTVSIPKNYRVGVLEQHLHFTQPTILAEACLGLPEDERTEEWRVEKILSGLGFSETDMARPPAEFSGGYQIRLNLAKLLVSEPDMLLLDEPNNYLDIVAIRWLEEFLCAWRGEMMLITHDRNFMDRVTTHTMAIHRQKLRKVEGDTDKLYTQLDQEEEIYEKTRLNEDKQRKKTEQFIARFKAKARFAALAGSRIKMLEKQDKKEELSEISNLEFTFTSMSFAAGQMMGVHNLSFGYDGAGQLFNDLSFSVGVNERICIIGKNGKGKSTLLRVLAGELDATGGTIKQHQSLQTGYFGQTNIQRLNPQRTVYEEIMSADTKCSPQRARNIAGSMMFSDDAQDKHVSVLSGGEKSRVSLGKVLVAPCHLLLLDEPTNHLDMQSCDALMDAIEEFNGSVIMVTHNEMILEKCAKRLIVFDNDKVSIYEGGYRDFLDNVGWQSEHADGKSPKKAKPVHAIQRQQMKKAKAELQQERSREIQPLQARIKDLESTIAMLEKDLHDTTEHLIAASSGGDAGRIAALSKHSHELKPRIEMVYAQLDRTISEFELISADYNKRLEALTSEK